MDPRPSVIYLTYSARALTKEQTEAGFTRQTFAVLTTIAFLLGAACSAASGYVGMWVSVRANVRVAGAEEEGDRGQHRERLPREPGFRLFLSLIHI